MTADRLAALAPRIERLALDPGAVVAPWTRLVRPILRSVGWQPAYRTAALGGLLDAIRSDPNEPHPRRALLAVSELEDNIAAAERACVVNGRLPVAHAAWLRRLWEVTSLAARAADPDAPAGEVRLAAAVDPVRWLPPLALAPAPEGAGNAYDDAPPVAPPAVPPDDGAARLVDLQLAAVDHLLDAAATGPDFLARRRRLLEAARQLTLETGAALPLEPRGVAARQRYIAAEIVRIDRLQAAGVDPEVALLHQGRGALARGERARLHAVLVALDEAALRRGKAGVAARTGAALDRLWGGRDRRDPRARAASLARSAEQALGASMAAAVREAYAHGRRADGGATDEEAIRDAQRYLAPGREDATFAAALAADGCFDVGGALTPVRVLESHTRVRAVPWPTPDLALVPARHAEDIPNAVIEDPRMVLLALAEGRLLTRRYHREETVTRARTRLAGEVRVYVLDGSGSMHVGGAGATAGARARVRDAMLVAELATLAERLRDPRRAARVALYYRYFNELVGPVTRVATEADAHAAVRDVLGTLRTGGTDIEAALVASLNILRNERARDPDLARAQIVLVTDGEALVREDVVDAARAAVGRDLPVGVSVVALGQENPVLRALVAQQRARGERAFYHFVDDATLGAMVEDGADEGAALHLPPDADGTPEGLADALAGLLDELAAMEEGRPADALDEAEVRRDARREVGLSEAETEGERAWREALDRDRRALDARYARWFPAPDADAPAPYDAAASPDADAAVVALATVAEVIGVVGGAALARRADAVDLLERLLPDARLSPARYLAALRAHPARVAEALRAVHAAVRGGGA